MELMGRGVKRVAESEKGRQLGTVPCAPPGARERQESKRVRAGCEAFNASTSSGIIGL